MHYKLVKATAEATGTMVNLMQLYIYDFSEFVDRDVTQNGLFDPYPNLDEYWNRQDRFPYFIMQDDKYLGFVLVKSIASNDKITFSIAEFFVLRKYRRMGVGRLIAEQIFRIHSGQWAITQRESNKPAQAFWRKVIAQYNGGKFSERIENERTIQEFNT
jgi:predicted acetyltransferase